MPFDANLKYIDIKARISKCGFQSPQTLEWRACGHWSNVQIAGTCEKKSLSTSNPKKL